MRLKSCLMGIALALAACLPVAAGGKEAASQAVREAGSAPPPRMVPAVHPLSGLPVIPLRVYHKGKVHNFRVELARTSYEQAKGLMFRTSMKPDEGMLFPMRPPREAAFWMRNTVISLDIIFIGTDGRISNIAANAVPYDETPLPSVGQAVAVLELNGGRAAQLGIVTGDRVKW